jgi:hypothetical protein
VDAAHAVGGEHLDERVVGRPDQHGVDRDATAGGGEFPGERDGLA